MAKILTEVSWHVFFVVHGVERRSLRWRHGRTVCVCSRWRRRFTRVTVTRARHRRLTTCTHTATCSSDVEISARTRRRSTSHLSVCAGANSPSSPRLATAKRFPPCVSVRTVHHKGSVHKLYNTLAYKIVVSGKPTDPSFYPRP